MDQILDDAERNGVMVQMVLNDHGQFIANQRWPDNPYNEANGGPVPSARPDGFFSDPEARDLFQARIRYIVARWGAYTNVLAWELFNEVQFVGSEDHNPFNDPLVWRDVLDWHGDIASYLDSADPYDHLVTTSSDPAPAGADLGSVAGIDIVQIHDYRQPPSNRGAMLLDLIAQLQQAHQKPVIVGEFGISSDSPPEAGFDPENCSFGQADCEHLLQGTHVHNAAWTAAMAGSGAMSWWWDNYIEADATRNRVPPHFPLNERIFPPLVSFFAGEDLAAEGFATADLTAGPSIFAAGLDNGQRALVWVRDVQNEFGTGARPGNVVGRSISGASVTLNGLPAGAYRVDLFDPYAIDGLADSIGVVATGAPVVTLPDFERDIAFKVEPNGEPSSAGLAQFEANGTTPIPTGHTTDGTTVVVKGSVSDPDGDRVRLEVEVKRVGVPFDGLGTIEGALANDGATTTVTVPALPRGVGYHWRARAVDEFGAASTWVSFASNPETERDLAVEAPIVFSSGNGQAQDVWIMNPDGSGLVKLTTNPGFDGEPALSPDGTTIAYASAPTASGARDIWIMKVDGSAKTQLTTNDGPDERPTWSADGSRIAYTSIRKSVSPTADIWSMKGDGTDQVRLTTANGADFEPNWSRDGTRIVFVSFRDGNEEIFVMNANGTGQAQLTFTSGNVRNGAPTWSNDGLRIAFASNRKPNSSSTTINNFDIYSVVAANPATITRLTTTTESDTAPSWSRDGRRIAFARGNAKGTGYDIWRMIADGSALIRLTTMAPNDSAPNW
jgi:Tol biopolymer transport system component